MRMDKPLFHCFNASTTQEIILLSTCPRSVELGIDGFNGCDEQRQRKRARNDDKRHDGVLELQADMAVAEAVDRRVGDAPLHPDAVHAARLDKPGYAVIKTGSRNEDRSERVLQNVCVLLMCPLLKQWTAGLRMHHFIQMQFMRPI